MQHLDEAVAWALAREVRATATGSRLEPGARVSLPGRPNVWVEVGTAGEVGDDPSGPDWRASPPPSDTARDLLDLFLPVAVAPDWVIGQLGQSLDGRIATEAGQSHYVTGRADIERLHRLRALADAVVVGAGTVAHDDPRLTVRAVDGESPVRVVLDPEARLALDRNVFTDGAARTLVARRASQPGSSGADDVRPDAALSASASDVLELPAGPEGFEPHALVDALRARGLRRILVEGGGITVSRFLQAGALDRLHVCVAPLLIGSGRPALTLPPVASLDQALRPRCRHFHLGDDLLFDLDLRTGPRADPR